MRLSTNQIYSSGINGILDAQTKMVKLEEQLVTGKRVLNASDDPSATQQALLLTERIKANEQYIENTLYIDNALQTEEVVLSNTWKSVERAYVLALTTGNTTNTNLERTALASELVHIREELFDLMNSKNAGGDYMFSGFQGDQQAYVFNKTSGSYVYQGDEGQRFVTLSETVKLPLNDPGKFIFDSATLRRSLKVENLGGATQVDIKTKEQGKFDNFYTNNYPNGDTLTLDLSVAGNYSINDSLGNVLQSGSFTDGDKIEFNGLTINPKGAVGAVVDLKMSQPTDNILNSITALINAMKDGGISDDAFQEAVQDGITAFQNAQYAIDSTRGNVGGRLNVADSISASMSEITIVDQATRSVLIDADVATTISELEKEEFALQAAQQGYVKVTQLTLFDFI